MPALATIDPPNGHAPSLPTVSKSAKAAALTAATNATAAAAAHGATDGAGAEARRAAAVQKKRHKSRALCYTPPTLINDRKKDRQYFRRGLLGEGGFARCFEVTDFQGTRLAAKTVAKTSILSEKVKGKLLGEIRVHKSMDHPHIVRQRDCFEDDVNVYMILELCPNGTLMEMLKRRASFTDPEIRLYGLQLLGATKYMHSRRVIHRDLKLGNLFLDEDMNLRVGDFGLAALLIDDDDRKKTICGTPNYIAPEVLYGAANGHSYEVDVWSIGVILYAMTVGHPPFQSKDVKQIYARIKVSEYGWPSLDGGRQVDPHLRDLITKLLAADPDSRPSIDDIAAHPFFNSGIMPKSIPLSALKQAPEWPAVQPTALFRRHHLHVTERAGVGGGRVAGLRQGQRVEAVVERPEGDRCLPPSLSPRTGPQARMVSLEMQRAGGLGIAERLEQARLSAPAHRPPHVQATASMNQPGGPTAASGMAGGARRPVAAMPTDVQAQSQAQAVGVSTHAITASNVAAANLAGAGAGAAVGVTSAPGRMAPPQRPVTRSSRYPRGLSEQAAIGSGVAAGSQRVTRSVSAAAAATRVAPSFDPEPIDNATSAASGASAGAGAGGSRTSSRVSRRSNDDALTLQRASASSSPAPQSSGCGFVAPRQVLQSLTICLASALSQPRSSTTTAQQLSTAAAAVVAEGVKSHSFISRWVDYSHKYGLGYCLRTGATGVHFNDGSSIVLEPAGKYFSYVHDSAHGRSAAPATGVDAGVRSGAADMERHLLDGANHRPDMAKKVLLLKHFRDYMHNNLSGGDTAPAAASAGVRGKRSALATTSTGDDSAATNELDLEPEIYLTKYRKLSGGILFVLSDGTVQCNFTDHSKLAVATAATAASSSSSSSKDSGSAECFGRFIDINKRTTDATVALLARGAAGQEGRDKLKLLYAHLAE